MEYNKNMTTRIQARIEESLKEEVEVILRELGISTTELIRMTYRQVVLRKGIPFDVRIPNAKTMEAFEEAEKHPEKLSGYSSVDEAFNDMWK